MKRLLTALAMVVMMLGFSAHASANFLDSYNGGIYGLFNGQETVLDQNNAPITDEFGLFTPGNTMYGVFGISKMQALSPASSTGELQGSIYNEGAGKGSYFAVLTGLTIAGFSQETGQIFFTGGTISLYYAADAMLSDVLTAMRYDATVGDYVLNGKTLNEYMGGAILEAAMVGETTSANVSKNELGVLTAQYKAYANVLEGYESWANGGYGTTNGDRGWDVELSTVLTLGADYRLTTTEGSFRANHAVTPEPGSMLLMGAGLAGVAFLARRRRP